MRLLNFLLILGFLFPISVVAQPKAANLNGLTVLSESDVYSLIPELAQSNITKAQAQEAAQKLETLLESEGYFLAEVVLDEVLFKKGQIHLDVYEGFISEIIYDNQDIVSQKAIDKADKYIEKIKNFKPIHRDDYEKYILLAEEMAGVDLETALLKSKTLGAADAHVRFTGFNRVDAFTSIDNMLNKGNGPLQYSGGVIFNIPEWNGQTAISAGSSSKSKRARFLNLSHNNVFGSEGFSTTLAYHRNQAKPNPKVSSVSKLDASGLALEMAYPKLRSLRQSLIFKGALEGMKAKNRSINSSENYEDRVNSLRLNAHYEFFDRYYANVIWEAQISQGLNIFAASDNQVGNRSRNGAVSDYTKLNLSFYRLHYLPNNFSWLFHVYGQYGFNKLMSSEEFDFGGHNFGRGYEDSRISGDSGAATKLELHYLWHPKRLFKDVDAYIFYDYGAVFNKAEKIVLNGENRKNASASSAGFGVNLIANRFFKTQFSVGRPLTYPGKYGLKLMFKITANMNHRG